MSIPLATSGVPNGCVLEFSLRSVPPETTGFDPLAMITGGGRPLALRQAVAALHRAANDPRVAGLISRVQLQAAPAAAVQELREAIAAFSAVKPSLAWAETYPGTLSYYLASAFSEVWMQPAGNVGLVGFASNATFLRDALDKAGIEAQFVARGEYKSAANLFTEGGFTDSHREAVTRMLESLQAQVWQAIGESRNIDPAALDALADRAPLLRDEAVASGLVDRIGFRDEAHARIAEMVGVEDVSPESDDSEDTPPRLNLTRYAGASRPRLVPHVPSVPGRKSKPTLAVDHRRGAHRQRPRRAAVPANRKLVRRRRHDRGGAAGGGRRRFGVCDRAAHREPRRFGHRVGDHLARGGQGP